MKVLFLLLSILILFNNPFFSQTISYDKILKEFIAKPELKNANIGIYSENISTGEIIIQHNQDISLIPASVFKIIPTSMSLELFGPDHTFKTELAYSGKISSEGILNGNLYIIGYGDPCLGSGNFTTHYNKDGELLEKWASEVKKAGIKKINGNIVADISYFGEISIPDTWIWEDIANYYGHQGSALNYYDNLYHIHFTTGVTDGSKTAITKIVPSDLGIDFENHVTSSSTTGDESYIYMGADNNKRVIKGTLPWKKMNYVIKGSMPEPELYLVRTFTKVLKKNGIDITGTQILISESDNEGKKVFHTTFSPSLQIIAEETNLKSNNLYAEVLSYHIKKKTGLTYEESVKDFFKSKKIDSDGLNIADASGLSHFNTLTTKQMSLLLKYMRTVSPQKNNFLKTLPVAGVSGTLSRYSIGRNGKVQAKSGSMKRVRAYAGYLIDNSGNEMVFCFIVNNYSCNNYQMRKNFENLFNSLCSE